MNFVRGTLAALASERAGFGDSSRSSASIASQGARRWRRSSTTGPASTSAATSATAWAAIPTKSTGSFDGRAHANSARSDCRQTTLAQRRDRRRVRLSLRAGDREHRRRRRRRPDRLQLAERRSGSSASRPICSGPANAAPPASALPSVARSAASSRTPITSFRGSARARARAGWLVDPRVSALRDRRCRLRTGQGRLRRGRARSSAAGTSTQHHASRLDGRRRHRGHAVEQLDRESRISLRRSWQHDERCARRRDDHVILPECAAGRASRR